MTNIAVSVPPSLQKFREPLRGFFEGMVYKLHVNAHKQTPSRQHIHDIITLLRAELEEFEQQLEEDKSDTNSLVELQDAANFCFLAYVALRMEGVKTGRELLIEEFLDIDTASGKVFCKKVRRGSQYRVGQEILGTRNKEGYTYIKLQKRRGSGSGGAVTLPRSHLVWWKATGSWPTGLVDHRNRNRGDDRFENLKDSSFSDNNLNNGKERKFPSFVSPYLPTGRSHLAHYGKFVYQRYHKGKNIRCSYYDTPEEAASKGYTDWLKKTEGTENV